MQLVILVVTIAGGGVNPMHVFCFVFLLPIFAQKNM